MEKKRHYVVMRRFIILFSFIVGIASFFISYNTLIPQHYYKYNFLST